MLGLAEDLTGPQGATVLQPHAGAVGVRLQLVFVAVPIDGDPFGDRKSLLRVADGGLQQFTERHGTETPVQLAPSIDRAGDGDGVHRGERDLVQSLFQQVFGGEALGRATRTVEAIDPTAFGEIGAGGGEENEIVAADAGRARLHHALHGAGGNRGVGGIAAATQNLDGGERGKGVRGGGGAMPAHDDGAARQVQVTHGTGTPGNKDNSGSRAYAPAGRMKRPMLTRRGTGAAHAAEAIGGRTRPGCPKLRSRRIMATCKRSQAEDGPCSMLAERRTPNMRSSISRKIRKPVFVARIGAGGLRRTRTKPIGRSCFSTPRRRNG
ncbi:hypothetical protein D9M70_452070 [compost metagenome]